MSEFVTNVAIPAPRAVNKRTKFISGGAVIALAIVYLIVTAFQSSAAYFLTIDELRQRETAMLNRNVRVSGKVYFPVVDQDFVCGLENPLVGVAE